MSLNVRGVAAKRRRAARICCVSKSAIWERCGSQSLCLVSCRTLKVRFPDSQIVRWNPLRASLSVRARAKRGGSDEAGSIPLPSSAQGGTTAKRYRRRTEREIGKERSRRGGQDITSLLLFRRNTRGIQTPGIQRPCDPCRDHLLPSLCQVCLQLWQPTISTWRQSGRPARIH